jgi:hypothetical protein
MRTTGSKTRLFLIEMIIIILFFALAAAVCANVFVKAHLLSAQSADLSMAVIKAQTAAECVKETEGNLPKLCLLLNGQQTGQKVTVFYDKDWETAEDEQAVYTLEADVQTKDGLLTASITMRKGDEEIYSVNTGRYMKEEALPKRDAL